MNGKMCLPRLSLQLPLLPQRRTRSPRKEAPLRVLGQRPPVTIAKATAPCWTLWVALRSALTCRSETGSPVPAEYGVSRHPTRARPVDSGEGKGAGPGAAWLQTKESPTPSSRPNDLPLLLLDLPSAAFPAVTVSQARLSLPEGAADKMRESRGPQEQQGKSLGGLSRCVPSSELRAGGVWGRVRLHLSAWAGRIERG